MRQAISQIKGDLTEDAHSIIGAQDVVSEYGVSGIGPCANLITTLTIVGVVGVFGETESCAVITTAPTRQQSWLPG